MAKQKKIEMIVDSYKAENSVYIKLENQYKGIIRKKYYKPSLGYDVVVIDGITYGIKRKDYASNEYVIVQSIGSEIDPLLTIKKAAEIIEEMKEEPAVPQIVNFNEDVKHSKYEQIKLCVENNIPVYLYGPAGSGKNFTLQQIAEELGLEFYFTNSVQQEYKVTGFIDAGGNYHETEFYKAFKNGGLFFLDEMDASIPEVLVLLNAAITNGYFEFPNGKITASKEFRVVAAGNTVGDGANEQYTGRLQLDQATLDRFALIDFDYDRNIEIAIAQGNLDLVNFIRNLRTQAQEKGIRATFSYRAISMVTKLEGKLEVRQILLIAVLKGLDKDTINTFNVNGKYDKYSAALKEVQMGA